MDVIAHIAQIPLFEGLPENNLEGLARIVVDRQFGAGETVFLEGQEGTGFYVMFSGRVKVYKLASDGKEQILHIFGPGEPFGEIALFEDRRFPAYAETIEKSRILFFPRSSFLDLIKKDPSLALNMLGLLSQRLRRFTSLIEDLSLKEVPGRLAAYLLYLSRRNQDADDLTIDISKGQLASLLGTIPETLSRILTRLIKAGFIQEDARHIFHILDRRGLQELAEGIRRLS
ncbi:MAG: Crp/Fnr family transcriptional regulator [bacterium]